MSNKIHKITGIVTHYNLETGFWGIEDQKGNQWRLTGLPEGAFNQLKGKKVNAQIEEIEEEVSMFMWGKPAKIRSIAEV